ncbi:MAG: DinB family protein [Acidobacteria bacterium]|nr:DinB family protein [Acidobacteriota bacterium]
MKTKNIHLLRQAADLLQQIDDRQYIAVPRGVTKSGIGGHVRHCLDFYSCFVRGLSAGRIDYDARVRNELLEHDRHAAQAQIAELIAQLQALSLEDEQLSVQVRMEGEPAWSYSSIFRELQFLLSHTIHHFALVAMLLRLQGCEPAADFGVALSTLNHWQQQAA